MYWYLKGFFYSVVYSVGLAARGGRGREWGGTVPLPTPHDNAKTA